jgi:O-antigen/teichoic acid export membrane protein
MLARHRPVERRVANGTEAPGVSEFARLGRNTGFSAVTFALRIGVHVLLLVLAARRLSTEAFGQYTLAISLGSILAVLCDYGFNFLATREVAKAPEAARLQLADGVLAKAWLAGVALVLLVGILAFLGSSRTVVVASTILTVSFLANSYGSYLTAIFKGLQRFDYETLATTMLYGVLLVTQIAVLWLAPSPVNLALCFLASRVVFLLVCAGLYRRVVPAGWSRPDAGRAWRMLRESSPFAWYTFSAVLSVQLGTVVLSYFAGETAVGEFQKALRFGMAATIPLALAEDVFYAFLSRLRAPPQSTERYAEAVIVLNGLGAAIILPLVSATALYGQQLVRVVYGGSVTAVVGESVVVVMGGYLLLYLLFVSPTLMSLGREHANLAIWVVGAGSSVIANLLLIPRYGVMGAAYAMLITYGALKLAFVFYARWLGLRLTDAGLWIRGIVPHVVAFLGLRWGNVGVGLGLPTIGLVGLLSVWWLLPAQRRVTLWQASSAR